MFKSFLGGIHPHDGKDLAKDKAIEAMPPPEEVVIPLSQHIGAPCSPTVKVGDTVKRGQVIGTSEAFMHADIHASISGKVVKIDSLPHSGRITAPAIVIKNDGEDAWADGLPLSRNWESMDSEEILEAIRSAGIVGMGGATFPAHIKLKPQKQVDILIVNGAECEPYLTADYRLMLEEPERIVTGAQIMQKLLGVKTAYIGVEDNKPEAVTALQRAASDSHIEVVALPTKYPQGAEKMLIYALTGREVPTGGLPMDVGCVVQNAGTVAAIADAVEQGLPLTERITTVSGDAVQNPKNLRVRIGTRYRDVLDYCGGFAETPAKILAGGPMMGFAQYDLDVPVMKGSSGILALTKKLTEHGRERACIRCGRCVQGCPMGLIPSMLSILSERGDYTAARDDYGLMNCIECGSCTFVCPAKRNIVQYVRLAKGEIRAQMARDKAKAASKEAKK
ncbi:MAG: electron transport complex subunit RsxC [Selenomonadaceae bacterium]|nr:electron transport complex subunit RsxC [Selenomonadaceae bacterium]